MIITSLVLAFVAALIILESLFILFFPREIKSITLKVVKDVEKLRTVGIVELVVGILVLGVSLFF